MKKDFIFILFITVCLFISSCKESIKQTDDKICDNIISEFALCTDDTVVALNDDISQFKKEPIKVKDGSGDGFIWSEYEYYDITVKALKNNEKTNIIKITTSSPEYETSKGIRVGDSVELLKELYSVKYQENEDNGDNYLYDPQDDLGFKQIRFYVEDEIIKTIELEDTIDG